MEEQKSGYKGDTKKKISKNPFKSIFCSVLINKKLKKKCCQKLEVREKGSVGGLSIKDRSSNLLHTMV